MLFSNEKNIIYFSGSKVFFSLVNAGRQTKNPLGEFAWNYENLEKVLKEIKSKTTGKVRILLDEQLAYILSVLLDKGSQPGRAEIAAKAQELIPEDLNKTGWDYKKTDLEALGKNIYQVTALTSSFYEILKKAIIGSSLEVEAIEPISCSLVRPFSKLITPYLVIFPLDGIKIIVAGYKGIVLLSKQSSNLSTDMVLLKDYLQKTFGLQIKKVCVSEGVGGDEIASLEQLGYELERAIVTPDINLALKEDLFGKDENILNINLSQELAKIENLPVGEKIITPKEPVVFNTQKDVEAFFDKKTPEQDKTKEEEKLTKQDSAEVKKKFKLSPNAIFILIVIITLILGALFIFYLLGRGKADKRTETNGPLTEISPVPTIKEETAIVSVQIPDYKVTILNGGGKAGEAGKVSELLKPSGFVIEKTGNADNFNYLETEIQISPASEIVKSELDKLLGSLYAIKYKEETLPGNNTVIIIIGSKKL